MFFFLAQTEQGDIFKITLETDEDMVSIAQRKGEQSSLPALHHYSVIMYIEKIAF